MAAQAVIIIIAAYLLGSVSSAVLICRLYGLPDPRESGSGNPGATNVLRLGGRVAAVMVLVCDILKGMLPVWGAWFLGLNPLYLGFIGIAACLGHIYPIFFHFNGGKGVATALGALAPIGGDLATLLIATWLAVVAASGYSSLGSVAASLCAPLFTWFFKPEYTMAVSMLSCLILWRHSDNIVRLIKGQESKIWNKMRRQQNDSANEP
uniref:glycerol-3-phosphate 1-O-acyltransferase PlsY n=1 Tax=Thaumasiovibrio occultus TaxID=1891184 RepID=UPI000B36242B|nr:glycerol-3-phosphate 1-O-acyltransferase PlsY [Thaumasiovibrio occultus]